MIEQIMQSSWDIWSPWRRKARFSILTAEPCFHHLCRVTLDTTFSKVNLAAEDRTGGWVTGVNMTARWLAKREMNWRIGACYMLVAHDTPMVCLFFLQRFVQLADMSMGEWLDCIHFLFFWFTAKALYDHMAIRQCIYIYSYLYIYRNFYLVMPKPHNFFWWRKSIDSWPSLSSCYSF